MIKWQKLITYLSELQSVWKNIKPKAKCQVDAMNVPVFKQASSSRPPDTYTLGFIFFQTLCNSLKYVINFCRLIIIY